jgi:hypothetical protein
LCRFHSLRPRGFARRKMNKTTNPDASKVNLSARRQM